MHWLSGRFLSTPTVNRMFVQTHIEHGHVSVGFEMVTIQPVDAFFAGSGGTEPVREYSASALSIVSSG